MFCHITFTRLQAKYSRGWERSESQRVLSIRF